MVRRLTCVIIHNQTTQSRLFPRVLLSLPKRLRFTFVRPFAVNKITRKCVEQFSWNHVGLRITSLKFRVNYGCLVTHFRMWARCSSSYKEQIKALTQHTAHGIHLTPATSQEVVLTAGNVCKVSITECFTKQRKHVTWYDSKVLHSRSVTTDVSLSVQNMSCRRRRSTRPTVGLWDHCCPTPGIHRYVQTARTALRPRVLSEPAPAADGQHTASKSLLFIISIVHEIQLNNKK